MDDLSNLTDEELDKKLEGTEEEESPEELESTEEVEAPEEETEEEPEKPEEPSRRQQLRAQQLYERGRQDAMRAPQGNGLDYGQSLDTTPEVISQLEADRRAYGEDLYKQGLNQAQYGQWNTLLRVEAPQVEKDFGDYLKNPAAAQATYTRYLNLVGYDPGDQTRGIPPTVQRPDVSYRDFMEAEVEYVNALVADRVQESTKNIAKQAATTGLRPDGSSAKRLNLNKAPEQMTDEELDAVIAQGIPPR